MNFTDRLRSLMLKTAIDFDKAASTEPTIDSVENGTLQASNLDEVLATQQAERESLWNELHELEERQRMLKDNQTFGGAAASDRKLLMIARCEFDRLHRERENQEIGIPLSPVTNDETISDIQFRERLQRSVKEMTQLVSFVKDELTNATSNYQHELNDIDESQQIQDALAGKIQELQIDGPRSAAQEYRDKMVKARQQYQMVMESLMDFLDDHYPPHSVDRLHLNDTNSYANLPDLCDMKHILEDLMNRAILNPSNPYIELKDGTYWSPYIETLVKGNIALRHPENSNQLKLVDFRIY